MEKKLNTLSDLDNLKSGDMILIDTLLGKDTPTVFIGKLEINKYSCIHNGRKCRSLGRINKVIKYEYADEVGETGDELIYEYDFMGNGSFTVREDSDLKSFNVRLIDENHPLYNVNASKGGSMVGRLFNDFDKIDLSDPSSFGNIFGSFK